MDDYKILLSLKKGENYIPVNEVLELFLEKLAQYNNNVINNLWQMRI